MKRAIKKIAELLCLILLLPVIALITLEKKLFSKCEMGYIFFAHCLAIAPGILGDYLRRVFYRFALKQCGADFTISFGSFFSHRDASVGDRVYIGSGCILGKVDIKDDVLIASKVSIPSGRHQHHMGDPEDASRNIFYERLTIGKGAWIGEGAMVLASVGDKSVVGSGSVLVKPIGDDVTAVGNPAREISKRQAASSSS